MDRAHQLHLEQLEQRVVKAEQSLNAAILNGTSAGVKRAEERLRDAVKAFEQATTA